jgi:hypothetical protein
VALLDIKSPFEPVIMLHKREQSAVNALKDKLKGRGNSKILVGLHEAKGNADGRPQYNDDEFDIDDFKV